MDVPRSEYAITKVNMSLPTKRTKLLRTYGKKVQAIPESRDEPPAKRRRTGNGEDADDGGRAVPTSSESSMPGTKVDETMNGSRMGIESKSQQKSSILSFFRPVQEPRLQKLEIWEKPKATSRVVDSSLSTDAKRTLMRTPRLLRLRIAALPSQDYSNVPQQSNENPNHSLDTRSLPASSERALPENGQALNSEQPTKPASTVKPKASVQTTLNVSCQSAFSECKLCDIVWNPLFPDDAAYHKRRHAALLRMERKRKLNDL